MPPDPSIVAIDEERPFAPDELFFSTTDRKGIIRSGNQVFARVSGYPVDRLLGQPHNIIRHPDMPKAVFKLLWDYLEAGRVFAGFVKNMAIDGRYYWVMALVLPIDGGYLSIRLKPTSAYFGIIPGLYASLLRVEQAAGTEGGAWRAGMANAGRALGEALTASGFANYDRFMHTALAAEMASHRARLAREGAGRQPRVGTTGLHATYASCLELDPILDDLFTRAERLREVVVTLDQKSIEFLSLARHIRLISMNALVAASRLGESGRGLAVVTGDLAANVEEATRVVTPMAGELAHLSDALRELAFATTTAKLQIEMAIFFLGELLDAERDGRPPMLPIDQMRGDVATLVRSSRESTTRLLEALEQVQRPFAPVADGLQDLRRTFRKLNVVKLTGMVQAASLAEPHQFDDVFRTVEGRLEAADEQLKALSDGVATLAGELPYVRLAAQQLGSGLETLA
ncbi:MAG: PAS domain-containing protein [Vicinamibacterales bacterium]